MTNSTIKFKKKAIEHFETIRDILGHKVTLLPSLGCDNDDNTVNGPAWFDMLVLKSNQWWEKNRGKYQGLPYIPEIQMTTSNTTRRFHLHYSTAFFGMTCWEDGFGCWFYPVPKWCEANNDEEKNKHEWLRKQGEVSGNYTPRFRHDILKWHTNIGHVSVPETPFGLDCTSFTSDPRRVMEAVKLFARAIHLRYNTWTFHAYMNVLRYVLENAGVKDVNNYIDAAWNILNEPNNDSGINPDYGNDELTFENYEKLWLKTP